MKTLKTILLVLSAAALAVTASCTKQQINETFSMDKLVGSYEYTETLTTTVGDAAAETTKATGTLVISERDAYSVNLSGWIAKGGSFNPSQALLSVSAVSVNDGKTMIDYTFEPSKVSLVKDAITIRFSGSGYKLTATGGPGERIKVNGTLEGKKK